MTRSSLLLRHQAVRGGDPLAARTHLDGQDDLADKCRSRPGDHTSDDPDRHHLVATRLEPFDAERAGERPAGRC